MASSSSAASLISLYCVSLPSNAYSSMCAAIHRASMLVLALLSSLAASFSPSSLTSAAWWGSFMSKSNSSLDEGLGACSEGTASLGLTLAALLADDLPQVGTMRRMNTRKITSATRDRAKIGGMKSGSTSSSRW